MQSITIECGWSMSVSERHTFLSFAINISLPQPLQVKIKTMSEISLESLEGTEKVCTNLYKIQIKNVAREDIGNTLVLNAILKCCLKTSHTPLCN